MVVVVHDDGFDNGECDKVSPILSSIKCTGRSVHASLTRSSTLVASRLLRTCNSAAARFPCLENFRFLPLLGGFDRDANGSDFLYEALREGRMFADG